MHGRSGPSASFVAGSRPVRDDRVSPPLWDLAYAAATIALTAIAQLALKWRMGQIGGLPEPLPDKIGFLFGMLLDPLIFVALVASALAWLTWIAALVRMDLGEAYSLLTLSYVLILLLSGWLLHEPLTAYKLLGVALIVAGTVITTRG